MAAPFVARSPRPTDLTEPTARVTDARPASAPPAWFALRCSVPDGAQRASVWRSLKKMGAVNVQRSLWIVRDDPEQRARAEGLVTRVPPDEGRVEIVDEVPPSEARLLQARLQRSCERSWDDLVDRLDDYDAALLDREPTLPGRLTTLTALVEDYARRVSYDLVSSATGARIARRLRDATDELAEWAEAEGLDDAAWRRSRAGLRRHVRLVTSWPLVDGQRVFIAALHPQADPLWERSFERFEDAIYTTDDGRTPLRAGVFRWVDAPGSDDAALVRLSRRVEHFEATLG